MSELRDSVLRGRPGWGSRLQRSSLGRWVVIAGVIAASAYFLWSRILSPAPEPVPLNTAIVSRGSVSARINSTGTVAPMHTARLNFRGAGRIAEVLVATGDVVPKGQPLMKLDTAELQLQVTQAGAQLKSAEARLSGIRSGSRAEDITAAQAQVAAAESRLEMMLAGGRTEEIESAEAALASARARLNQLRAAPTDADRRAAEQAVASAQSALQRAENDLARLLSSPLAEDLRSAELDLERAKSSLWAVQTERDGICGNPLTPEFQCNAANARVSGAEIARDIAAHNLARVQAGAKPEDIAVAKGNVEAARAQYLSAEARLQLVLAGPSSDDLAAARAAVTQAEQQLALRRQPFTEAELQAQRQALAQAQAVLASRETPYTEADLLAAEANVEQARAQLEAAELNLANAVLAAPFDGVVGLVNANPGEIAAGSVASPVVTMASLDALRLEVSVDEADVVRVRLGQQVLVTFDALPGEEFDGEVIIVSPEATLQAGVAVYLVTVSMDRSDVVKSGMTGNASIIYAEKEEVLVVPNRALKTIDGQRVVDVLVDGVPQVRPVRVGIRDESVTEILDGLTEGEEVVVSVVTTAAFQPHLGPRSGVSASQPTR